MSEPVPGTGRKSPAARRTKAKSKNGAGVSAGSRVLPHRYADEGEKGGWIRRLIRRREARLWKKEAGE
ncbi:hypothetical protein PQC18_gp62 [Streptomyces phage Pablito]|uniref:Uncharacterized protein n=1 Tax=Streptomyces phage Pablito TaxID=2894593 RepID=A0AAE8YJS8_9CAUD|nr:hypothetical protein PQC18_gp62 [Streptomyces phage Pablito]UFD98000.1 hypothetical protein [Streptomyces phage Pablito]